MHFSGNCNQMCTHPLMAITLASHNQINGWNEYKEGINVRESINIGKEWKNRKDHGGFGDGWCCCFLAKTVSQEFSSIFFCKFDRLKENDQNA